MISDDLVMLLKEICLMEGNGMLILPVLFPVLAGILVLSARGLGVRREVLCAAVSAVLAGTVLLTFLALASGEGGLRLWQLTRTTAIEFRVDGVGRIFAVLTSVVWLLVGIYSFVYMTHQQDEHRFFGFFLIVLGVLLALDFSANLITFYLFYELMTLTSLPLVLHERTKEAVMAGLKYLFYSVAGAFLALFGIFFLTTVCNDLTFTPGGVAGVRAVLAAGAESAGAQILTAGVGAAGAQVLAAEAGSAGAQALAASGQGRLLLAAVFCMLVGFGTKAGMFPLHGWLPTAHPVAPAPASAVLSGVITKCGVLAVIRVVYYVVGPDLLRGTWVQQGWIFLTLATVFMGSMLAYREPVLKKRLAYSTVSQVSYVLFGLSLMEPTAFVGALAHVVFHSLVKNALFLIAGAIIFYTGWTRVEDMKGLGRFMPVTLACHTLVSLALVGIPPTSGFISKWYLALGALSSGTGVWEYAGPAVLLVSALLTAGYLLPLSIHGFFPGEETGGTLLQAAGEGLDHEPEPDWEHKPLQATSEDFRHRRDQDVIQAPAHKPAEAGMREPDLRMLLPIVVLTAGAVLLGCFPGPFLAMLETIAGQVF